MEEREKSLSTASNSEVVENWVFSLIPVGVAFVFYLVFILQSDIENKNLFIAYGATAGFIGLESYWITQGLRKQRSGIVVMGVIGIALTLGVLYLLV